MLPDTTRKLWMVTEVDGSHSFGTNKSHLCGRKGSVTLSGTKRVWAITRLLPSAKWLSSQRPSVSIIGFSRFYSNQGPKRPVGKTLWPVACCQASLWLPTNHLKGPRHTNITSSENKIVGHRQKTGDVTKGLQIKAFAWAENLWHEEPSKNIKWEAGVSPAMNPHLLSKRPASQQKAKISPNQELIAKISSSAKRWQPSQVLSQSTLLRIVLGHAPLMSMHTF